MRPPSAAAQSSTACGGRSSSGQASRSSKPKRTAALIHEAAMLLPSPDHATHLPALGPRCSPKDIPTAMSWQGWGAAGRPVDTGTGAFLPLLQLLGFLVGRDM